jgi:hypothetical protein
MFNVKEYIKNTRGASIVYAADANTLLNKFPNEVVNDVTVMSRNRYAETLSKGWRWVFEVAEINQPKFFRALENGNPSLFVANDPIADPFENGIMYRSVLFLECNNIFFRIEASTTNFEQSIQTSPENGWVKLFNALPAAVANSYYLRTDGINLTTDEFYMPYYHTGMPGSLTAGAALTGYLSIAAKKKNELRAKLVSVADNSEPYLKDVADEFRVLLDTGIPGTGKEQRNILFYQMFSKTQNIFWLQGLNFEKIQRLTRAAEAMDDYTSKVLNTGNIFFDFSLYVK